MRKPLATLNPPKPQGDSWWIGLDRPTFQAEATKRYPEFRQTLDSGKKQTPLMPNGWESGYDS